MYGVLQAAGLLFFAFAGYARIATLGEEVHDPERTIPRAIPIALAIAVVVYALVGVAALAGAGPERAGPQHGADRDGGQGWRARPGRCQSCAPVPRSRSLGALLALIAGIGRTGLAMARNGDLPRWLAAVDPRHQVPHHAELAVGAAVAILVLTTDLRGAIGFSSFGVLTYYAVANASAFTQGDDRRRWPRALNVVGLIGCLVLVVTLPVSAVLVGVGVLLVGLVGRAVLRQTATGL